MSINAHKRAIPAQWCIIVFYDKISSVKTSNVLVTDRFIIMLEDTLDVLEELTDKLKVETDPARYRELRVSESRESLIDSVLMPIRVYLKGPFWPLDESEKNLLSKFAEYCDAIRHFVLYELTNHIPGSEMPDKIEGLLDKSFGIMRKTMFEPKEPKCDAVFEELRNCFNAASEEMRIRIKQGLDRSNAVIVGGFTEKAAIEQESIMKKALRKKRGVSKRINKLTQVQVAKDFDVDRQTIIRWESTQTEDGPNNKSNEWGYYKGLRTNPDLRDAYCKLVNMVAKYNEYKKACREAGKPLYTFYQYNEAWAKHNKKY